MPWSTITSTLILRVPPKSLPGLRWWLIYLTPSQNITMCLCKRGRSKRPRSLLMTSLREMWSPKSQRILPTLMSLKMIITAKRMKKGLEVTAARMIRRSCSWISVGGQKRTTISRARLMKRTLRARRSTSLCVSNYSRSNLRMIGTKWCLSGFKLATTSLPRESRRRSRWHSMMIWSEREKDLRTLIIKVTDMMVNQVPWRAIIALRQSLLYRINSLTQAQQVDSKVSLTSLTSIGNQRLLLQLMIITRKLKPFSMPITLETNKLVALEERCLMVSNKPPLPHQIL